MIEPIVKTVDVNCAPDHAFDVFVNRIAAWWPLDGHATSAADGKAALAVTIEPKLGGRVFETRWDGTEAHWGDVLAFDPPTGFAMTWHPGNNAGKPTKVAVDFEDIGDGKTRVTLTHSGWEIWGDEAVTKRGGYDSGWGFVFVQCYVAALDD